MKRREFITLLGGAAASWPPTARAQQPKLATIGYLGATTPSVASQMFVAFVQRLHELGWIEGRNITIEARWAEGWNERYAEIAAEFVRLKVDVIVAHGNAAVIAAKQATSIIPIVFLAAGDPLGTGLVSSLARPGGNMDRRAWARPLTSVSLASSDEKDQHETGLRGWGERTRTQISGHELCV